MLKTEKTRAYDFHKRSGGKITHSCFVVKKAQNDYFSFFQKATISDVIFLEKNIHQYPKMEVRIFTIVLSVL